MKKQQGFTLIELMIVIAIIAIIAAIAIPNLLEARKGANESAAIASLRTIVTVQALFRDTDKDGNGVSNYAPDLTSLSTNGQLVDSVLALGTKQGYVFVVTGTTFAFTATGIPQDDKTGERGFFVDESGVIRFATGGASALPLLTSSAIGG